MKYRALFVCLLGTFICLAGCGEKERIEGTVNDIFGNPLKDVTIKIEKSEFTAVTDESGRYSLDYAPGTIKLTFSKSGFTTMDLHLNILQKVYYPTEPTILYPIPDNRGLFYVDTERNKLVELKRSCKIEEIKTGGITTAKYRYFAKYSNPALTIKPGIALFITRDLPPSMILGITAVNKDGLFFEGFASLFDVKERRSGIIKKAHSLLGKEHLHVISTNLSTGSYALIGLRMNRNRDGFVPVKGTGAIGVKVEAARTN